MAPGGEMIEELDLRKLKYRSHHVVAAKQSEVFVASSVI